MPGEPETTERGVLVREVVHVELTPHDAFRLFTEGIADWWPLEEGYSYGGDRARDVFLEPFAGGRFTNASSTATSSRSAPSRSARPRIASSSPGGAPTGRRTPRSRCDSPRQRPALSSSWSIVAGNASVQPARRWHGNGLADGHGSSKPSPNARPGNRELPRPLIARTPLQALERARVGALALVFQ
jgi:hypothetical protein